MKSFYKILEIAKKVIITESDAVSKLVDQLNDDFVAVVELILSSEGRLIVAGVGKSANVGSKIVATFNSTGQPAIFLHPTDAIHGDLGNIQKNDIVICISKSGSTSEIEYLLPIIKNMGNKIIAITGNTDSYLAVEADFVIDTTVNKEACPYNLTPTSSSTAQLVIGDALAICLLECRNFSDKDFARFHPGGTLGKRLYLKVSDIAKNNKIPSVQVFDKINSVIIEISQKRLGATAVLDDAQLVGIITDGDLRRMLEKGKKIDKVIARDIMNYQPRTISSSILAIEALKIMKEHNITQLLIVDNKNYMGIIHMHDILKEGIA